MQLDLIEQDFRVTRDAGCKYIVRFAYSRNIGIKDAPLKSVLRHIEQLRSLLEENTDVILVWRHVSTGQEFHAALPVDPRLWLRGERHSWTSTVQLPAELRAGRYELALWLSDPEADLRRRVEYAILLAN